MNNNNSNTQQSGLSRKEAIFDWLDASVKTIIISILIFTFILSFSTIVGDSMVPTLYNNERILVWHRPFKPKYKDIVIVTQPNYLDHIIVKRIIATEGQTVDINLDNKTVSVDGTILEEPYIYEEMNTISDVTFPVTVPKNCFFVMGDNRNISLDSRNSRIGMIDKRYIKGKVALVIRPFNKFRIVK